MTDQPDEVRTTTSLSLVTWAKAVIEADAEGDNIGRAAKILLNELQKFEMELINLCDGLIVHSSEITRADRNGDYTEVWLRGQASQLPIQIRDDDGALWRAICRHALPARETS